MNTIVGNLTFDPELKFLDSGTATARMNIAVNKVWNDKQGQKQESTSFFTVTVFGSLAENVASSCHKGDRMICVGDFEQRSWDGKDGEKKTVVEFKANEVGPSLRWTVAIADKSTKVAKTDAHKKSQSYEEPF
jgi:single-strand DNA-binding protein